MRLVGFNGDLSASNRVGKGNTYPSAIYASIGGFERIRRPWPELDFVHFPHEGLRKMGRPVVRILLTCGWFAKLFELHPG
jgi:hypothetical protein